MHRPAGRVCPSRQGEGPRVAEFVLGLFVELLPAGHPGGVDGDDAVADRLLHDANQYGDGVLDRGAALFVDDPVLHGAVDDAVGDHSYGKVAQSGDHAHPPSREIGVEGLQLQPTQREVHVRVAVFGEFHGGERWGQSGLRCFDDGVEPLLCLVLVGLSLRQRQAPLHRGIEPADARTVRVGAITRPGGTVSRVGAPQYEEFTLGFNLFLKNIHLTGGVAPARAYIPELLPDVLSGAIQPGRVFDRTVGLDDVPDGYKAMNDREALKVLIRP